MYFEKVKKKPRKYSPHNVRILWALKNYILYVVKSVKFHELAGGGGIPPPWSSFKPL